MTTLKVYVYGVSKDIFNIFLLIISLWSVIVVDEIGVSQVKKNYLPQITNFTI